MAGRRKAETAAPSLETRIQRLEEIATALEREDIELDDALGLFEEGIAHLREAKQLLGHADLRIERLVTELDGTARLEPIDGGA
jgi:exodeoxyribonuclease VII small subunit